MNISKISAGITIVVFVCGICLGFVIIEFGNGVVTQASEPGASILFFVGYIAVGIGYLVIGASILCAVSALVIGTFVLLIRWVRTKYLSRNGANTAKVQPQENG
jgi:hypothetical protein